VHILPSNPQAMQLTTNEPKFQKAKVDFVEKATYCLRKK
jgi:hypothetical protein